MFCNIILNNKVGILLFLIPVFMHNAHRSSLFHDTASKNIVLLIPALAIMDNMWGLTGVIACQTIVEYIIAALSFLFYLISIKKLK